MVWIRDAFYVFGGWDYHSSNIIARLETKHGNWTKVGKLNHARRGHNVIAVGDSVLLVGDYVETVNEKCTFENDLLKCVDQKLSLNEYFFWPELFLVPDSFCKS